MANKYAQDTKHVHQPQSNELSPPMIGQLNTLKILKEVDFGLYLDGGKLGEILLPIRYVPQGSKIDDDIEVFLYHDSEDRVIVGTIRNELSIKHATKQGSR